MAFPSDDLVIAILADKKDSQTPTISPIESLTKRASMDHRGFQLTTEQNRLPGDETSQSLEIALCPERTHQQKFMPCWFPVLTQTTPQTKREQSRASFSS